MNSKEDEILKRMYNDNRKHAAVIKNSIDAEKLKNLQKIDIHSKGTDMLDSLFTLIESDNNLSYIKQADLKNSMSNILSQNNAMKAHFK